MVSSLRCESKKPCGGGVGGGSCYERSSNSSNSRSKVIPVI